MSLSLHVAHLDHGMRPGAAEEDAAFVRAVAATWGLPFHRGQADVPALAAAARLSLEEAARQARYGFLAEVAAGIGAQRIATGHTMDDQAETVLMHFLRGSGVAGLRGMLPVTDLADYRIAAGGAVDLAADRRIWLVRPLLEISRAEVEGYCELFALEPRVDRSNEDLAFFRNRLRHHLLPALATYNPMIRRVLAHTASVMAGDQEVLQAQEGAAWREVVVPAGGDEVQIDLAAWRALPLGLQRATLRKAVQQLRRHLRDVDWEHVERAVWLARSGTTGDASTLVGGLEARIAYGRLRVAAEGTPWLAEAPQLVGAVMLDTPGLTMLPGGWQVEVVEASRAALPLPPARPDDWTAYLDAGKLGDRLELRPRRPGERFQPLGMGGHRVALSEFMINARVPRDMRQHWPILAGSGGIAWVAGLRVGEFAAVTRNSTRIWQVTIRRIATRGTASRDTGSRIDDVDSE